MRICADGPTHVCPHTHAIIILNKYMCIYCYTTHSIVGCIIFIYLLLYIIHCGSDIVRVPDRRRSIIVL